VSDLATVPGDPGQRPSVDDQASADPDLAGDEQHVVKPDGGTATVLRERPQICLVGNRDGQVQREDLGQPFAKRDVTPTKIGRHPDETVLAPDRADHCGGDTDDRVTRGGPRPSQTGELGEVGDRFIDRQATAWSVDPDLLEDLPTESDDSDRERVHGDLEG
jgi:hypothetical protein